MTEFEDCNHDTFERLDGLKAVYECADCEAQIVIPELRWIVEPADQVADGDLA